MPPNGEAKQDKKKVYEAGPIAATEAVVLKIRATVQSVTILCAVLGSGKGLAAPAAYVVTSIEHPQQLSFHFILATQDFVLSNCSMGRVISLVVFYCRSHNSHSPGGWGGPSPELPFFTLITKLLKTILPNEVGQAMNL